MKSKLLIILALFLAQASIAQVGTGNLFIGGGFGFNSSENNSGINLSPTAHYFISDNLSIGGSISFGTNRSNPGGDVYERRNSFGIAPAVRYWKEFGDKVYIYGQASLGFTSAGITGVNGNQNTDLQSTSVFGIGINPGLVYAPTERLGFDLGFSLISFNRQATTNELADPTTTNVSSNFSFAFSSFNPSFGIYYIIGN